MSVTDAEKEGKFQKMFQLYKCVVWSFLQMSQKFQVHSLKIRSVWANCRMAVAFIFSFHFMHCDMAALRKKENKECQAKGKSVP